MRINVDFDKSGTSSPYSGRAAATDAGTSWNIITQPASSPFTRLNLTATNGTPPPYDVTISSSGGAISAWNQTTLGNPSPHGLMDDYLVGNTHTVTVSDLPAGTYQLYFYAHGDAANQISTVTIHAANGGGSATTSSSGDQYRNIHTAGSEAYSYFLFKPVVGTSGTLVFTVNPFSNSIVSMKPPIFHSRLNIASICQARGRSPSKEPMK